MIRRIEGTQSNYHSFPIGPSQQEKDHFMNTVQNMAGYIFAKNLNLAEQQRDQAYQQIDSWHKSGLISKTLADDMHNQVDTIFLNVDPNPTIAEEALNKLQTDINNA